MTLQVNYPPYLFEVVLYQPVDDTKSKAQVGGGAAVFTLEKKEPGIWSRLTSTQSGTTRYYIDFFQKGFLDINIQISRATHVLLYMYFCFDLWRFKHHHKLTIECYWYLPSHLWKCNCQQLVTELTIHVCITTCNMTLDNLFADDKELMKSKRQQAIEVAHRKAEKEREERAKEKREKERYALQQQMKVIWSRWKWKLE